MSFLGRLTSSKLSQCYNVCMYDAVIACLTLNGQETTYTCHVRSFCVYEGGAKIHSFCPFFVNVGPFDLKQVVTVLYYTCLQRCDNSVEV